MKKPFMKQLMAAVTFFFFTSPALADVIQQDQLMMLNRASHKIELLHAKLLSGEASFKPKKEILEGAHDIITIEHLLKKNDYALELTYRSPLDTKQKCTIRVEGGVTEKLTRKPLKSFITHADGLSCGLELSNPGIVYLG